MTSQKSSPSPKNAFSIYFLKNCLFFLLYDF
jgi:hypothetical protein